MARPKAFSDNVALQSAIDVFAQSGFEGTSTDALTRAMGIGRQSLYDTFGDKWSLYLKAVQRYTDESVTEQIRLLEEGGAGINRVGAMLSSAVTVALSDPRPSCLGISAVCEFGQSRPDLAAISEAANRSLIVAIEQQIVIGQDDGSIASDVDANQAAVMVSAALVGIKVAARGGASADHLRGIVHMTLRSLR